MEEHQVTIDRRDAPLPEPFFLVATQNPFGSAGTFPLPESQLDRFALVCILGRPAGSRTRDPQPAGRSDALDAIAAVTLRPSSRDDRRGAARALRATRCSTTCSMSPMRRAAHPGVVSARRRARASAVCTPRKRHATVMGATSCRPTTSRRSAVPALAHRLRARQRCRRHRRRTRVVGEIVGNVAAPARDSGWFATDATRRVNALVAPASVRSSAGKHSVPATSPSPSIVLFTLGAYGVAAGAANGRAGHGRGRRLCVHALLVGIVWPIGRGARLTVEAIAPLDATVGTPSIFMCSYGVASARDRDALLDPSAAW
jgi:hypothetical protein